MSVRGVSNSPNCSQFESVIIVDQAENVLQFVETC